MIRLTIIHAKAAEGQKKIKLDRDVEAHDIPVESISSVTSPSSQESLETDDRAFAKVHLKSNQMFFDGVAAVSLLVMDDVSNIISRVNAEKRKLAP